MYPSEVRRQVLRAHEALRRQLERIEAMAEALARDAAGDVVRIDLARRIEVLADAVEAHVRFEDEHLRPALEESTNWRDVCLEDMRRHHEEQRREVRRALDLLREHGEDRDQLVGAVERLVEVLRADLEEAERDILVPSILADDPLLTDNVTD